MKIVLSHVFHYFYFFAGSSIWWGGASISKCHEWKGEFHIMLWHTHTEKPVNLFLQALISCLSSGRPAYSWPNGLADSHKLNLGRELRWVANGLASVLTIKTISRQTYPVIHWLIGYYNNKKTSLNLHWLKLGGQTVKNFLRRACKFESVWPGLNIAWRIYLGVYYLFLLLWQW